MKLEVKRKHFGDFSQIIFMEEACTYFMQKKTFNKNRVGKFNQFVSKVKYKVSRLS